MSTIQEERVRGRPARVGVLQAIRRYPLLAIIPAILLTAVGAALGIARNPNYTATAQLSVGQLNVSNPAAVGSVLQASEQLASVYSRAVGSNSVRSAVRRDLRGAKGSASIDATPIPDSPIVKVSATSDDQATAVRAANSVARALVGYARRLTTAGSDASTATRFRAAALLYAQRQDAYRKLQRNAGPSPSGAIARRLAKAQADVQSALLLREGLRASYTTNQQGASTGPPLQTFSVARGTTSDRARYAELLALLGLIAGAALGAALATARLNRRVARLTRP